MKPSCGDIYNIVLGKKEGLKFLFFGMIFIYFFYTTKSYPALIWSHVGGGADQLSTLSLAAAAAGGVAGGGPLRRAAAGAWFSNGWPLAAPLLAIAGTAL